MVVGWLAFVFCVISLFIVLRFLYLIISWHMTAVSMWSRRVMYSLFTVFYWLHDIHSRGKRVWKWQREETMSFWSTWSSKLTVFINGRRWVYPHCTCSCSGSPGIALLNSSRTICFFSYLMCSTADWQIANQPLLILSCV